MNRSPRKLCLLLAGAALAGALAGCMSFGMSDPEAPEPFRQPLHADWEGDAFIAENHTAADGLVENLEARLPRAARILCATFVRQDDLESTSAFGRLTSAQFASRLVQAGYSVVEFRLRAEMGVRDGQGEFLLTRQTAQFLRERYDAHAVLVGSYVADSAAVFVSGQVVRLDSGVAVAAYDYAVPNRGLVARLVREDGASSGAGFDALLRPRAVTALATPAEIKAAQGQPAAKGATPAATGAEAVAPIRLFPPTSKQ
jgi:hypothetical protein